MLLRRHRAAGGCAADRATHTCPLSKRKWLWRDVSGDACRPSIGACNRCETCAEAGSRGFFKLPLINDCQDFIWSYVYLSDPCRVSRGEIILILALKFYVRVDSGAQTRTVAPSRGGTRRS